MVKGRAFFAVAAVACGCEIGVACGGSLGADAAPTCDVPDATVDAFDASEEPDVHDTAPPWWEDVFDAGAYYGYTPPIVGEYPPNGPYVCLGSGCFVGGTCDPQSGWCCSGKPREDRCMCGDDAGCVPPSICCALPGALVPVCVATPDECPEVE